MRRIRDAVWLMVLVAFSLRLAVIPLASARLFDPSRDHWSFGYETGRIARAIASGRGFSDPLFEPTGPTALKAPVFPYLLAGIFKLFGIFSVKSAWAILALNSLFSALTCLPVFWMARKSFGQEVAVWAGWTWTFFPYAVYLSTGFVWENILTGLLLGVLFVWTLRLKHPAGLGAWVGYGLLWALDTLANPVVLSVLPFLAGWACYRLRRQNQRWLFPAACAALAFLIALVPWTLRNYRVFHRFMLLRDNFWMEVWVGNNGDTSHWFVAHPSESKTELEEYDRMGEIAYIAHKQQQTLAFIGSHPGAFAWTSFRRFLYVWTGYWSFDRRYLAQEPFDPANIAFCMIVTVPMLLGLRRAFREAGDVAMPYALLLVFFPLIYYFTHPKLHYRHTIDPEIVVLAVYGIVGRFGKTR
jgi:4-amino-4-deoxy-L-arabinose transferase-like glycosyltransferase